MNIKTEINEPIKPTEKQVTIFISQVSQLSHEDKQYKKLLQVKEQLEKQMQNFLTIQQLDKILHPHVLITKNISNSNLCYCCYEQIKNKTNWCKICGNVVCKNCLNRIRELQNQEVVKFCDTCDKKFIEALIARQYQKQKKLYLKAFQTLISQQETLQNLLSIEKAKLSKTQVKGPKKQVIQKFSIIEQLEHQKKELKQLNLEIKSKIDWGKSITSSLKKKQRQLRKLQQQSFGSTSSINQQQMQSYLPKAQSQLNLDIQNLNQSFAGSNKQNQQGLNQEWISNDRRTCQACALI